MTTPHSAPARLTFVLVLIAGIGAIACSGTQDTEEPSATVTEPAAEAAIEAAEEQIALCTEPSTIPLGATSCRLDLGAGTDSWWTDTDGVDPAVAGCHIEYEDAGCTEVKEGRMFGELCLDADRLVESNPGADECHTHGADLGHPDVVSCSAWCQAQGSAGGSCEDGIEATGNWGTCSSARCSCT